MVDDLKLDESLVALPGGKMILLGVRDLHEGKHTVPAAVCSIASMELRSLGLPISPESKIPEPEFALYEMLLNDPSVGNAYSKYNAYKRELNSFISARRHEVTREARKGQPR